MKRRLRILATVRPRTLAERAREAASALVASLGDLRLACPSPSPRHAAQALEPQGTRARGEGRSWRGQGPQVCFQGRAGAELHSHPSDGHSLMRPYHQTLPGGSQHPFRGQLCLGCRFYLLSKTSCFLPKYYSFFPTRRGAFSSKLLSLPSHLIDALHNYHVFKNATLF